MYYSELIILDTSSVPKCFKQFLFGITMMSREMTYTSFTFALKTLKPTKRHERRLLAYCAIAPRRLSRSLRFT